MQDLPGATPESDIYSFQDHLSQKNIPYSVPFAHRADQLKIYPTLGLEEKNNICALPTKLSLCT